VANGLYDTKFQAHPRATLSTDNTIGQLAKVRAAQSAAAMTFFGLDAGRVAKASVGLNRGSDLATVEFGSTA